MFEFLQPYSYASEEAVKEAKSRDVDNIWPEFVRIKVDEITATEKKLGFPLPSQLRKFYEEIGYGFLGWSPSTGKKTAAWNRMMHVSELPELLAGTFEYMDQSTQFDEGALPFFGRDWSTYLVMYPQDENPNAVYFMSKPDKIADDLIEFFKKMYDDPDYFHAFL